LIKVQRNSEAGQGAGPGGRRGQVKGFSYASRRRFIRMIAKVERESKPLFVTLTFPDEYIDKVTSPVEWKRQLKAIKQRFARKFPEVAFIWRLEVEKRKSGKYVGVEFPHFHLMVYGMGDRYLKDWISLAWWEVCGRLSVSHLKAGTKVEKMRSFRGVLSYVSKYMAKPGVSLAMTGRIWGIHNIKAIPWVKATILLLSEGEAVQLIRYLRRYANLKGRDYRSLTVVLNAEFWWRNLDKLLYPK
jgi:hypothetical protein